MNSATNNAASESIKSLFVSLKTPAEFSAKADHFAMLADRAEGQLANFLANIGSALNAQRHVLLSLRCGDVAEAARQSLEVGRHLHAAGVN